MTAGDGCPSPISLPALDVILLAELLADLDGVVRSPGHSSAVRAALASYCAETRLFDAGCLIDRISVFAEHLAELTAGIDRTADADAAVADNIDEDAEEGSAR